MIGALLIKVSFAAAIASTFLYLWQHRKPSADFLRISRIFYIVAVAGVVSASGILITLIMTHQFQYYYVWNYSSTDLPKPLLFSTFYAGQEGSFMLWSLYTGIIGLFLLRYSAKKGYEPELMTIHSAILSFLLLMIVVKNPFKFIWTQFPDDLLHVGAVPADVSKFIWVDQARSLWAQIPTEGKGLNPLLQNYWMVIHPQILFLGFTSMSIPFSYAVAGMLKRDYVSWIRVATPWSVFGSLALGTGIILGGFWAYETLGWGGYWGWDPVENSSLIPWLICVASIHTMLAQRKNGSFIKTNFVLSMFCFIMVLYSTFLTRSGVLGETSVHSFVDPGMWVYWLLLSVIFVFAGIGFGLFFTRWKEMPVVPVEHSLLSREFALFLGASALVFASIFIVIGTSSPIITNILKGKTSAVDTSYYVVTTLPLGILIALLAGIGQLLWWKNSKSDRILEQLRIPAGAALAVTIGTFLMGANSVIMLIFIFASSLAFFTNAVVGYRIIKGNAKMAGGSIAHIGIAMMFLGFVASAKYDNKVTVNLEQGKAVKRLGYTMTYLGYQPRERGRYAFNVEVEKNGEKFIVAPVMFQNNEDNSLIRNPDIINLITKDFYVSPLSLEVPDEKGNSELTVSEAAPTNFHGMTIRYLGYDFSQVQGKGNLIVVNLEVTKDGKTEIVKPSMLNYQGQPKFEPASLKSGTVSFTIKGMSPNKDDKSKSSVTLHVTGFEDQAETQADPPKETLVVEASIKPYINLVWMGTAMMVFGFLVTISRRLQEAMNNSRWK